MKSIVNKQYKPKVRSFPKLMVAESGDILLATNSNGDNCTIVCSPNGNNNVGYVSNWNLHKFVDFEGSVTLSND